ncbi:KIR protein [Plasmodium coatneyi]|uniref:KIR protein n=1 Tax=Plasmodium coatneyi TaxID=208452 RepID=A0A1B1E858_9APIC|nr:KIR protein [Plasmodium coatneyi]ANQ11120.1 KIR protein [Plasmodium coatneyi]
MEEGGEGGILRRSMLYNLPSMGIYSKFLSAKFNESHDDVNKIESALETYEDKIEEYEKIGQACGLAFKMEKKDSGPLYSERCNFLFFWIGDYVRRKMKIKTDYTTFNNIMSAACTALQSNLTDVSDCDVACKGINWNNFQQRKEAYEYIYDHSYIKGELNKYESKCSKDCSEYVQKLVENYNEVHTICECHATSGTYCEKFEQEYTKNQGNGLSDLKCTNVLDGSDLGVGKMDLQDREKVISAVCFSINSHATNSYVCPHEIFSIHSVMNFKDKILKDAPSTKAYSALNKGQSDCNGDDDNFPTDLKEAWKLHANNSENIEDLKKVWCRVRNLKGDNLSEDERCHFSYYYIGHIFSGDLKSDESFWNFMDKVLEKLKALPDGGNKCEIVRSPFEYVYLDSEKRVYDSYKDYTTINEKVGVNGTACSKDLQHYLQEAALAYSIIKGHCEKGLYSGNAYCIKFNTQYKELIREKLLGSKCISDRAQGFLRDAEGVNAAATAISSILGIVGLPTIAFFLHKYNLLPPWISHYFGGGRSPHTRSNRGKRRSGAKSWDTLTDNDSTIGSTVASTSNLSRTTTENYTIYNGRSPPTRTNSGRNSNRQQQQRQRFVS